MILEIILAIISIVLSFVLLTQIAIPLMQGRTMFPILQKEWKLTKILKRTNQSIVEEAIAKEIIDKQPLYTITTSVLNDIKPKPRTKSTIVSKRTKKII